MTEALKSHGHEVISLTNLAFPADGPLNAVPCFKSDTYDAHRKKAVPKPPPAASPNTNNGQAQPAAGSTSLLLRVYRLLPLKVREMTTPFLHSVVDRMRGESTSVKQTVSGAAPAQPVNATQELIGALRDCQACERDVVLFHTCDGQTYHDVLRLFETECSVAEWNKLPVFRLSTPYDEHVMPHNKNYPRMTDSVRRLSNLGLIGTRVFLHAENELLAAHLQEHLAHPVHVLGIPPVDFTHTERKVPEQDLHIVYLGAARTEKGFTTLPALVKDLFAADLPVNIHVYIQVTPQILGYTPDVQASVEELRAIDDPRLELSDTPLDFDQYHQLVTQADVMLLLYDPERYAVRGSGIAVEAVISESTVVATAHTFPAFVAGDAGVAVAWGESALPAIKEVISHRERYRAAAQRRCEWYLEKHSASAFASSVSAEGTSVPAQIIRGAHRYEDATPWRRLL